MAIVEGVGDEVTIFLIVSTAITFVLLLYLSYFNERFSFNIFSQWMQHEISVEQQQELSSEVCDDATTKDQHVQSHQTTESLPSESGSTPNPLSNSIASGSGVSVEDASGVSTKGRTECSLVQDVNNCGTHVNISSHDISEKQSEDTDPCQKVQCNKEKPILGEQNDHATLRQRRLEFFSKSESSGNSNELHNETLDRHDDNSIAHTEEHRFAATSTSCVEDDERTNENEVHNDMIRVRLKYLNETEKLVFSKMEEKVGEFKRRQFSEDLANNKVVRLIYNGQLLRAEERTLMSYGISDNCVIHVHISQTLAQPGPQQLDTDDDLDLSNFLWPLLAIILVIVWFLHFQYKELFNVASTVVLLGITIFFAAVWGQTGLRGRNARLPQS